jgi:hypothetical protein
VVIVFVSQKISVSLSVHASNKLLNGMMENLSRRFFENKSIKFCFITSTIQIRKAGIRSKRTSAHKKLIIACCIKMYIHTGFINYGSLDSTVLVITKADTELKQSFCRQHCFYMFSMSTIERGCRFCSSLSQLSKPKILANFLETGT